MIDLNKIKARAEAATPIMLIGAMVSKNNAEFLKSAKGDVLALIAEVERLQKKYDHLDKAHGALFIAFNKEIAETERLQSDLDCVTAERDAIEPRYRLDSDSICYGCLNYKRISEVDEYRADDVICDGVCDISIPCFAGSEWRGERSE